MLFGMLPPTTSRHATRPHQHFTPRAKLNRCLAQCNGDKECKLSCKCLDTCSHRRAPNVQRPPSLDSATSDDITARDLTVCDKCIIDITRCERHCEGDPDCEARCECGRGNCPQCPWFKTKCPKPSACDESSPPIDPCTVFRSKISMWEQYCRGDKVCEADCKCNIDSCKHCPSMPMACPKVEARDDALKTDASCHKCILNIAICVCHCKGDLGCETGCQCKSKACEQCTSIPMDCAKVEARDDAVTTSNPTCNKCIFDISICVCNCKGDLGCEKDCQCKSESCKQCTAISLDCPKPPDNSPMRLCELCRQGLRSCHNECAG
jgi:hypothetical protein